MIGWNRECPRITIVTPCFNSERFLEQTILSVLAQEYPNLEYMIIDGGSTDNTVEIIKRYDKQLSHWVSEKDGGMYDAIQKGFSRSTGEIMAWIGSDDMYHKDAFYTVAELFSNFKNIQWLLGAATTFDEWGRTVNATESRAFNRYDFLLGDYQWLQQESCFWRRSLWEQAGARIDAQLRYAGDFELWIRFFRFEKLYVTNALLGGFRQRSSHQLSLEGLDAYMREAEAIIRREHLEGRDKRRLMEYKLCARIANALKRMKLFNVDGIMNNYRRRRFGNKESIQFDRLKQTFVCR
jgi:glycosyltransferase involved in cell wall biosynthesis